MEQANTNLLAGCVVLYNPDVALTGNITSYAQFLDVLYVIDNSENVNEALAADIKKLSSKIVYLPQHNNIGVAQALNTGIALAAKAGYKWLLTMDQDSYFSDNEFFDSWKTQILGEDKIGLVAASYTPKYDRWQKEYSSQYNEIHFAVTSGNVISLDAWQQVGGFEGKLFIDEVDHDYCLKLRKNGYKVLIGKKQLMSHTVGEIHQKSDRQVLLHNPVRYYYMARNVLYVCRKYFFVDFGFASARFYYLLKTLAKIILRYPDKASYLKYFFDGVGDFFKAKYGKYNKMINTDE